MKVRMLAVALWLLGLAIAGVIVARTPVATDMSAFLPRAPTPAQQMLVDQLREGVVSRLMLVAIDAAPDRLAGISRAMAADLRADARFAVVANGDVAALARERDLVWRNRYLLSPAVTQDRFGVAALHAALLSDLAMLGTDMAPLIKQLLPADPTGESLVLLQDFQGGAHPDSRDGIWVSHDGGRALMMVSTRAAGFDIDGQEQALAAVRAAFAAVPEHAGARLVVSGPPVFAVASRARIKGDAERLSMIATALVAAVLLLAYRSPHVLLLSLLPVASGALAGIAAVGGTFGFVHGITLGFGVTLIGEAVDYAIYLFTQTPPGGSPRAALRQIWPTLRLGMLTSVCGFSAMLFSHFVGFAQLGLFTIVGLVTALAVTRFVLPALLPMAFATRSSTAFARPVQALIRARRGLRWGVLAACVIAGVALLRHGAPYWQDELTSMSPIATADLAQDRALRAELGAPDARVLLVAAADDPQAALAASEHLAQRPQPLVAQGVLDGFDAPSRYLPSLATQTERREALPEPAVLRQNLAIALNGVNLRRDVFAPFLADVEAARAGRLIEKADLEGTGIGLQVESLLVRHGAGWAALLPLRNLRDAPALAAAVAMPGVVLLDLKRESDNLLASYRGEAVTLSAVGSLVILLLLSAHLRHPRRIAAVVLPLAAAVLCTAALLAGGQARLSIFNLFGLLLVVAVGSNYCLFFERPHSDPPRMVASLTLADICTVIGFGILGFSQVPVLHDIGTTVAIGACLSLVFGAVLSTRA